MKNHEQLTKHETEIQHAQQKQELERELFEKQ